MKDLERKLGVKRVSRSSNIQDAARSELYEPVQRVYKEYAERLSPNRKANLPKFSDPDTEGDDPIVYWLDIGSVFARVLEDGYVSKLARTDQSNGYCASIFPEQLILTTMKLRALLKSSNRAPSMVYPIR